MTSIPPDSPQADWIAWILHFIVGAFVGGMIGLSIISRGNRSIGGELLDHHLILPFIAATALMGAGLASFMGDKLWIGDNFRCIPPDGIPQSSASTMMSYAIGVLGCLVLIYIALAQFGLLPKP